MTDVFEFAEYERTNLIYNFSTMIPLEIDAAKTKLAVYEKEQADKKAAVPLKPSVPAGTAPASVPAAKVAATGNVTLPSVISSDNPENKS